MLLSRFSFFRLALVVLISGTALAEPIGSLAVGGNAIQWQTTITGHDRILLTVASPDGEIYSTSFPAGEPVALTLKDLGSAIDGVYTYELRVVPKLAGPVKRRLDGAARARGEREELAETVQSGSFAILGGAFVAPEREKPLTPAASGGRPLTPAPNDQVIPDDLIVQGSACVGTFCVNGEGFGDDTIRLKEPNLRIGVEDTSTGSFPSNDWELKFNEDTSGGQNKISFEDVTGAKTPFTVEAGAPTGSFYLDSTGRIGFRTATPAEDLHITTSNSPTIRFEQTSGGGFTAQTFDIGGNEANFFVRDVTAGDTLPFKIKPGAPNNALVVGATGSIALNKLNPNTNSKLDIVGAQRFDGIAPPTTDNAAWLFNEAGVGFVVQAGGTLRFRTGATTQNRLTITTAGDVGINCTTPTADFVIFGTSDCSGAGSTINAGATQFTMTSSREIKENLEPVTVPDLLDRIERVGIYKYDFKKGPKDKLGMMAEDFHQIFGRGSDKVIDGSEVQMALWLAVQQLSRRVSELEAELAKK